MLEYLLYARAMGRSQQAGTDALTARHAANTAMTQADELEQRLGVLELALETLTRLGVEAGTFTEEEFLAKAQEVDAEDGSLDGRRDLKKMRKQCSSCNKPNTGTRLRCMWCGTSLIDAKPVGTARPDLNEETEQ